MFSLFCTVTVEESADLDNLVVEVDVKEEVAPPPVCDADTYPDFKLKLMDHYKDILLDEKDRENGKDESRLSNNV